MKFAEMTTEQATTALVKVADPITKLGSDEDFQQMIIQIGDTLHGKGNRITKYAIIMGKVIPFMLRDHKTDLYTIVSAMTEKSVTEVASQNIVITAKEIMEFFDDEFVALFTSAAKQETPTD